MIYLDNAATTFPKPKEVYDFVDKINRTLAFNAGRGESKESQAASDIVEEARVAVASLENGIDPSHVVFASSATEALNILILGLGAVEGDTIYISPFEHNAIIRPLERLKDDGVKVKVLPFDENWEPDLPTIERMFVLDHPLAIFLSAISNVTGARISHEAIFALGRKYDSVNVLDAAQAYGIHPLCGLADADYVVFAGHKTLYGCFGVGGFIVMRDRDLPPVICGGTGSDSLNPEMPADLPYRYEAGSRNVSAIASLIPGARFVRENRSKIAETISKETKMLIDGLSKMPKTHLFFAPNCKYNGIVSFAIDGYKSDDIGTILANEGISVRTGYHCAPLIHDFIGSKVFGGTVRVSLGVFNNEEDIITLLKAVEAF